MKCESCDVVLEQQSGYFVLRSPVKNSPKVAFGRTLLLVRDEPGIQQATVHLGLPDDPENLTLVYSWKEYRALKDKDFESVVLVESNSKRYSKLQKGLLLQVFRQKRFAVYNVDQNSTVAFVNQGLLTLIRRAIFMAPFHRLMSRLTSPKIDRLYEECLTNREYAENFARSHYLSDEVIEQGGAALDVGCGRGRHVAMLSQLGFCVTGLDLALHEYWQRINHSTFYIGGTEELAFFSPESFDLVVCVLVLTYVERDDEALKQIARLLKPGGRFWLQVTNQENLRTKLRGSYLAPEPNIKRYYTIEDIEEKVHRQGFYIEKLWTDRFYSPIFTTFFNFVYSILLSEKLQAMISRLTPRRYRGVINLVMQKPVAAVEKSDSE